VLFTGVLVAIGALVPTAKDAGVIFGSLIFAMFIPFCAISLIISDLSALIVQVFTFLPLTAPVTAMLRNGFSILDVLTAGIVIAELVVLGVVKLRVAVGLFCCGFIACTDKLNLCTVLGGRRLRLVAWPAWTSSAATDCRVGIRRRLDELAVVRIRR
jgi:ABC-2 type transport system permease protein